MKISLILIFNQTTTVIEISRMFTKISFILIFNQTTTGLRNPEARDLVCALVSLMDISYDFDRFIFNF